MRTPVLAFFATILFFSNTSHAQMAAHFCEGIKNTANLVVCLNKYYGEIKLELANEFNSIVESLDPDNADAFKKTQQAWIKYRDSECAWEMRNEAMQSLKRVKENVLNDIYGDIYWKANSRIKADLNCNGREENLILGMRNSADGNNTPPFFVIGLVESPAIGKPSPHVFDIPLEMINEDANPLICAQNIQISLRQNLKPDERCERSEVEIQTKACGNFVIRWQDDAFNLVSDNTTADTIR
mgnify:CR=1 FL=1